MSVPTRIQAINIIDAILLPLIVFMAISLGVRLKHLNDSVKDAANHVEQAPWMHRSAVTAMLGAIMFMVGSLLMKGNPNTSPRLCSIVDGFWGFSYGSHKLGVYSFVWFRISTFSDFFSDSAWKKLRIFSGICFLSYSIVILAIVVSYSFDTYDVSQNYCTVPNRIDRPENTLIGACLVLLDLIISGTGLVAFTRLLWCSPVLGKLASRDPKIGEAARNIVKWSVIALLSTPMSIILTMVLRVHYGLIDVDVALNCFCIAMQYPKSLFVLFELLWMVAGFGPENETTEMVDRVATPRNTVVDVEDDEAVGIKDKEEKNSDEKVPVKE